MHMRCSSEFTESLGDQPYISVDHGRLGYLWKPHLKTGTAKFSQWNFNGGKTTRILWKPKCLCRVRKSPPLASVLSDKAVSIVKYSTDQKFTNLLDTVRKSYRGRGSVNYI